MASSKLGLRDDETIHVSVAAGLRAEADRDANDPAPASSGAMSMPSEDREIKAAAATITMSTALRNSGNKVASRVPGSEGSPARASGGRASGMT
jgi:hypothetical protein